MYVGPFFIDLLTQYGMAEVAKIVREYGAECILL